MSVRPLLLSLCLSVCAVLPAHADGEVQKLITAADKARLDKYGETRKAALDEAKAGDPAEAKQLDALLAKPLVAFSDKDLTGNWPHHQGRRAEPARHLRLVQVQGER